MEPLTLPWPPKELSPNARVHWRVKSAAVKKYRSDCYLITRAAKVAAPYGRMRLEVIFFPPNNRRRDLDNLIASMKAAFDGIAQALHVDDSRFALSCDIGPPVKNPGVQVKIVPIGEN